MKRNFFILLVSMCFCCGIAGCSGKSSAGREQELNSGQGGEVEMTDEQKELLKKISVNEEKIEEGQLYEWQKEVLNQYDYAMNYLQKKYPECVFHIVDCDQKNNLNTYTTFTFTEEKNEELFDLYLYVNEEQEEKYTAKDNFYGVLLAEPYATAFLQKIRESFPQCVAARAEMVTVQGEEINAGTDVSNILSGSLKITNNVTIYVDGNEISDCDKTASEIEEYVHKQQIYGSYCVFVCKGDLPDTAEAFREKIVAEGKSAYEVKRLFQEFLD